jgi:hypothetical protein
MLKKILDFLKLSFSKTPITKNIIETTPVSVTPDLTDVVVEKKKKPRKKKVESAE